MKTNETATVAKTAGKTKKLRLMQHMEKVVELSKDSKLSKECFEKCKPHTAAISKKLGMTELQALMMSVYIDQSDNESIRISDLAKHFDCRNINVMSYSAEIDGLVEKSYIRRRKRGEQIVYRVPIEVVAVMNKGQAYITPTCKNLSVEQLFDSLERLYEEAENQ